MWQQWSLLSENECIRSTYIWFITYISLRLLWYVVAMVIYIFGVRRLGQSSCQTNQFGWVSITPTYITSSHLWSKHNDTMCTSNCIKLITAYTTNQLLLYMLMSCSPTSGHVMTRLIWSVSPEVTAIILGLVPATDCQVFNSWHQETPYHFLFGYWKPRQQGGIKACMGLIV